MREFLFAADGHVIEPADLWATRLPKQLRDRAIRCEFFGESMKYCETTLTNGAQLTFERFRHHDGEFNDGDVERRLRDLDADGIWGEVCYPNVGVHMFVPDHELAIAHARVYNDYVVEAFGPYRDRLVPAAAVPLTDVDDAVVELERAARMGLRAILVPVLPPKSYATDEYDPVWAAAQANGLVIVSHIGTGFASDADGNGAETAVITMLSGAGRDVSPEDPCTQRMHGQIASTRTPGEQMIISIVTSGVLERFPELQFLAVEFNANWLASLMGALDKAFTLGIGQDRNWEVGFYDHGRSAEDQPAMGKLFPEDAEWPYPLQPSEYVRRQVHVTFMDDPVAIACRHITGIETLLWGADYPHAEGTWPCSRQALDHLFAGVDPAERAAIVGGTAAALFDIKVPQAA